MHAKYHEKKATTNVFRLFSTLVLKLADMMASENIMKSILDYIYISINTYIITNISRRWKGK